MTITQLLHSGVIYIATSPPENWQDVESASALTVPLIAEDYPAKTAVMWNTAYETLGFRTRNSMMVADPKDVATIITALRQDPKYQGGGAGVGFKEVVLPHLDEVTPLAQAMGAVNIIKKTKDGKLVGDNTDGLGYTMALEELLKKQGKTLEGARVLMLGAGGSGRAIAFSLVEKGAKLTLLNRTLEKAVDLARALNTYFPLAEARGGGRDEIEAVLPEQDVVVSVIDDAHSPLDVYSTVGAMDLPITPESVTRNQEETTRLLRKAKSSLIVSDIRIRKEPTAMLSQAQALGFATLDGIPMVINQGIRAFCWVHEEVLAEKNIKPEVIADIMKRAAHG